jgi:GPH family glycoside/pentoside/hexuronide:cation symporter
MGVAALASTLGTLSARARLHAPEPRAGGSAALRLFAEVGEVFRNSSFLFLFGACLVAFVGFGEAAALSLHANTFFWRLPPAIILVISLSAIPGIMIGLLITGLLTRVAEKRTLALAGLGLIAVAQVSPVTLRLIGLLPPIGPAPVIALIVGNVVGNVGVALALVGFQSMMADAADEHDLLFGARREGLYFAGISFAAKASTGLGVLIAGLSADAIGFPNDLAARGPHATVPWPVARDLALIYGPGAAVITTLGLLLLFGYKLDRAAHGRILETLAARKAAL